MRILICLCFIIMMSCGNETSKKKDIVNNISLEETDNDSLESISVNQIDYICENDSLIQKATITFLKENKIRFIISSKDKRQSSYNKVEGIALSNMNQDPEIDEDSEGNAYPAIQYIYEEGCFLSIRIEMDNKDKLQIVERNCNDEHIQTSPLGSVSVLNKVDK